MYHVWNAFSKNQHKTIKRKRLEFQRDIAHFKQNTIVTADGSSEEQRGIYNQNVVNVFFQYPGLAVQEFSQYRILHIWIEPEIPPVSPLWLDMSPQDNMAGDKPQNSRIKYFGGQVKLIGIWNSDGFYIRMMFFNKIEFRFWKDFLIG